MWIYVWSNEIKNAYIGANPIKEIFAWENKVRPEWKREPNANTVAYRPLNSTTTNTDQSWNGYNLTKTWGSFTTLWNVSCFYNGGSTTWYFNLTSASKIPSWNTDRTICLWVNPSNYTTSYDRYVFAYWENSNWKSMKIMLTKQWYFRAYIYGNSITSTYRKVPWWHQLTITTSWNTFNFYENWALIWSDNSWTINTTSISSSYPLRLMRLNSSTSDNYQIRWYLSEVIIEDKTWTADEVLAYYNQTKWNYE